MPDYPSVNVFYEGNDDKAFLKALANAQLLSENIRIHEEAKSSQEPKASVEPGHKKKVSQGKPGFLHSAAELTRSPGFSDFHIVILDLDDLSSEQAVAYAFTELNKPLEPERTLVLRSEAGVSIAERTVGSHTTRIAILPLGLPGDGWLKSHSISRFAMDDYVIKLLLDNAVYAALERTEKLKVSFSTFEPKLHEVAELFRKNGIEIHNSKRLLTICHAITGFRPSSAEFVKKIVESAAKVYKEDLRSHFEPFVTDLHNAVQATLGPKSGGTNS